MFLWNIDKFKRDSCEKRQLTSHKNKFLVPNKKTSKFYQRCKSFNGWPEQEKLSEYLHFPHIINEGVPMSCLLKELSSLDERLEK